MKRVLCQSMFGITIKSEREATRHFLQPLLGDERYHDMLMELSRRAAEFSTFPGVFDTLMGLSQEGYRAIVISTQLVATEADLWQHIRTHGLPIENVIVVRNDGGKLEKVRETKISMYVDDSLTVLESLEPACIPLVWTNFWDLPSAGVAYPTVHSWGALRIVIPRLLPK